MNLFLDVDGVMANYHQHYNQVTGGNNNSDKGKTRMERLKPFPHFFLDMPLCHDALELWAYVKQFNPTFLTAQSNFVEHAREDKLEWLQRHFGVHKDHVIICDYPKDKEQYARHGDILVDDRPDNCDQWRHAGGIAVHHTSAANTIAQLKKLMHQKENRLLTFGEFIS